MITESTRTEAWLEPSGDKGRSNLLRSLPGRCKYPIPCAYSVHRPFGPGNSVVTGKTVNQAITVA